MPKEGYRTITVPEILADILKERAGEANRSVPKEIEHLVRSRYPHLRPVKCQCGYTTHINPRKGGEKQCRNCGGLIV